MPKRFIFNGRLEPERFKHDGLQTRFSWLKKIKYQKTDTQLESGFCYTHTELGSLYSLFLWHKLFYWNYMKCKILFKIFMWYCWIFSHTSHTLAKKYCVTILTKLTSVKQTPVLWVMQPLIIPHTATAVMSMAETSGVKFKGQTFVVS